MGAAPRAAVRAAASESTRAVLLGPRRPARVLAAFPSAVYLDAGGGEVLAVLSSDAVRLPLGVVLARSAAERPLDGAAATGWVGDGLVATGSLVVQAARWWAPPAPREPRQPVSGHPGCAGHLTPPLAEGLAALELAMAAQDHPGAQAAADRLLGLGPGLTPAGDDVLAGLLVAGVLLPRHLRAAMTGLAAHVVARAGGATTALSVALLRAAARGHGCPELVGFVDALGGWGDPLAAHARLARVGHTSGRDMAAGVSAAAGLALGAPAAARVALGSAVTAGLAAATAVPPVPVAAGRSG